MEKDGKSAEAVTRVRVTKPLLPDEIRLKSVSQNEVIPINDGTWLLDPGHGMALVAEVPCDYTDTSLLSFRARGGNVKISEDGFIMPLRPGKKKTQIKVSCGGVKKTIMAEVRDAKKGYIAIKNPSTVIKTDTYLFNGTTVKIRLDAKPSSLKESVRWSVEGNPEGMVIEHHKGYGLLTVNRKYVKGIYTITAQTQEGLSSTARVIIR
jgi:hypothetical protein